MAIRKRRKEEPGARKERTAARIKASAMGSAEELAAALGVTINVAYEILRSGKVRAMRLRKRWLIPRTEIARLTGADVTELVHGNAVHLIEPNASA
jgi:excisionase family DNA binding protein